MIFLTLSVLLAIEDESVKKEVPVLGGPYSGVSSSLVISHSLLDSPTESFTHCEIICP